MPSKIEGLVQEIPAEIDVKKLVLERKSEKDVRSLLKTKARERILQKESDLSFAEQEELIETVFSHLVGFGPTQPFLEDPCVSEIMINGPEQIFIEREGKIFKTEAHFPSEQMLLTFIDRVLAPLGKRVDESSPTVDARLPDGSRFHCILPPLSVKGPVVTIRKFSASFLTGEDLIAGETLSMELLCNLERAILGRKNMVVAGNTSSGKTTLLNILSTFIPPWERIITIEDTAELRLPQLHVIPLETRLPNVEGRGAIGMRELVRNALRMRPDRIIIGECRGGETFDMLQAMNTGHDGMMTTCHANSPADTIRRIEMMALCGEVQMPLRAVREQIAAAIDVIVYMKRLPTGERKVTALSEVEGLEGETVVLKPIFPPFSPC